jgi:hypothetical protein
MRNREEEIDHNEESNNQDIITRKDSIWNKGKTSQSPSLEELPFFCCEKSYPVERMSSHLDQHPYLLSKEKSKKMVTNVPIDINQSINKERI